MPGLDQDKNRVREDNSRQNTSTPTDLKKHDTKNYLKAQYHCKEVGQT